MIEQEKPRSELILPDVSPAKQLWLRRVLRVFLEGLTSEIIVNGLENIPQTGSYIVAANHLGWVEAPVLLLTFPRWIHFMTKAETLQNPYLGPVTRQMGMFPVRREELDLQALRTAAGLLKAGEVLGMMPEGTRGRRGGEEALKEAKEGTILIGYKTKVPIVPVAVWGPENVFSLIEEKGVGLRELACFQKPPINVNIGKVFEEHLQVGPILRREERNQLATELMLRIKDLLPTEYHGIYAQGASNYSG